MNIPKTDFEYIRFEQEPAERRVTSIWTCFNKRGNYVIGEVQWNGAWRQYCFFPAPETLYSAGCLRDIQDFITALMGQWRAAK